MPLSEVEGQARAVTSLQKSLASGSVPHAWLFVGPEGVGKELAATRFAQALTCPEKPMEGCGVCSSCLRVLKRNHPDVTWLMPEDEQIARGIAGRSDFDHSPSRDIRVEQVRNLQERLSFRALEAKYKVALLVTADAMNPQAQNALLKTLEEPPRDTVLVLISAMPDRLLPTIRSRCAKAWFGPLSDELIAQKLLLHGKKKLDPAVAKQVAAMSGGSLSRAMSYDPKTLEARKEIIERFEALKRDDARGWLQFAEVYNEREAAEEVLEVLSVWLRDVIAVQAGSQRVVNADLTALAQAAAAREEPAALMRRMTVIDETRNAISARWGGPRLQLERMLIEMLA